MRVSGIYSDVLGSRLASSLSVYRSFSGTGRVSPKGIDWRSSNVVEYADMLRSHLLSRGLERESLHTVEEKNSLI